MPIYYFNTIKSPNTSQNYWEIIWQIQNLTSSLNSLLKLYSSYSHKIVMNFPDNLKYTQEHEWIRVEGDVAIVGITAFAQNELGDIVYVDINSVGQSLAQNEVFGTIEAVKTVSDLYLPIAAEIVEINPELQENPQLVNEDPYGKGWLVKVAPKNLDDINQLMDAATYQGKL